MTEAQWMASADPQALLRWLTYTTGGGMGDGPPLWFSSDRKLRLFVEAAGCVDCRGAVVGMSADRAADYVATADCGRLPWKAALLRCVIGNPWRPVELPGPPCPDCAPGEPDENCDDCGGDGTVDGPCPWFTPTVLAVARSIYDGRSSGTNEGVVAWGLADLGILADALEEAGCDDAGLLAHLRLPTPHALPGCWVIDCILGKD